jgi:hypothetical protein
MVFVGLKDYRCLQEIKGAETTVVDSKVEWLEAKVVFWR